LDGRPAGSFRIELQYLPGDDTVVMKAAGGLGVPLARLKVLPSGDGRGVAVPKGDHGKRQSKAIGSAMSVAQSPRQHAA
jgi:hypothetical protein